MKIYICLIIIFILSIIYFTKREGFKSDYSDYTTIDRVKVPKGYAYCLAGNVTCPTGTLTQIKDNYSGGNTYNYLCDNSGTFAECQGNFQYNMNGKQLNWKTPTAREISFPFSDEYKGFTIPYSYVPVDLNGNYMDFYDASSNVLDNIHKCDMLLTDSLTDQCKSALTPVVTPIVNCSTCSSSSDSSASSSTPDGTGQKCVANYGANTGDPLCCGQTGVLQKWSSEYVCPSSAPTCTGYSCGNTYGKCS